ncbi:MAG: cytidylate kinase-like family protein [Armatimonadetes bacterium]|nr:cytidylate kinase-like family protein [Armatimonadota bacterium]
MSNRVERSAAHLVARQVRMFQVEQQAAGQAFAAPVVERPAEPAPYVTISRQYGARGSEVAQLVAARLGWTLYDRALLEEIARDAHLQERLLAPFDEHARNNMEHWIGGLMTAETVSEHHYTAALFRVLTSIAAVGRAVIVGRGAHLALPPETGLRVRLYAPLADRLIQIAASEEISEAEARRRVERVEQTRQAWLVRAYGDRARETFTFDLALNTAALPLATCVELTLLALAARQPAPGEEAG